MMLYSYEEIFQLPPEFDIDPLPNLGPKVNHNFMHNNTIYIEIVPVYTDTIFIKIQPNFAKLPLNPTGILLTKHYINLPDPLFAQKIAPLSQQNDIVVGIDLGTTNSCVGIVQQHTREVEILANELGKKTTPSWVGFSSQNGKQIIVGENARDQETWVYDAKRMIGRAIGDEALQAHFRLWDF